MINMEKTIVIASNNKHKIQEFKDILVGYNILTLNDIGYFDEIEETGKTFEENAFIKAEAVHNFLISKGLNYIVASDDSGLCVDSLNYEPGINSARFSGEHGNDIANRKKLLEKLEGKERNAFFICTIALLYPDGTRKTFVGKTYGKITKVELGNKNFGYDCIFYSNDLNKTFGQANEEEKNSVSHRGRAIKEMLKELENK